MRGIRRLAGEHREVAALLAVAVVALLLLPRRPTAGVMTLGVVAAAGLALQAAGLVLVHRSNRFINFAQVAFGAVAATVFTTMVHARPAVRAVQSVCPPCLEQVTPAVRHANYALSFTAAVGVAAGLAWLSSRAVFRRFAASPRLVLTVASIFLLQLLAALTDAVPRVLTSQSQKDAGLAVGGPAPLPFDFTLRIGKTVLHAGDLLLIGAAAAAIAGITAWLRLSGRGIAVRAASERPERAETLGVDVGKLDGQVWLLAGLMSGVAGVLTATTVGSGAGGGGVTPVALLVRILAIAVLARMTSLWVVGIGAVAVGVLDQAAFFAFNTSEVVDGALLAVIAVALLLQRDKRPRADDAGATWRATREVRPIPDVLAALPTVRTWRRRAIAALALTMLGLPWALSSSQTSIAAIVLLEAIAGLSLLVLTGWAGQVSLGQFAFAAVGAWAAAASRLPFPLAVLVGAVAGAAVAVAVGIPAVRLKGLHLAVTTLAFALATSAFLLSPRYGGKALPDKLDRPSLLGIDLADQRTFYYLALAALAAAVASVVSMRRSRTARALIASRDNPAAAQSFGIDLTAARLGAFAVSGFLAAFAGALIAFHETGVRVLAFQPERSIRLFAFAVIGGLGSVAGPLFGFAYDGVLSLTAASPMMVGLSTGAGGLALLLLLPSGLSGLAAGLRDAWLRRVARRHRVDVPVLLGRTAAVGEKAPIVAPRSDAIPPRRYELEDQWAVANG